MDSGKHALSVIEGASRSGRRKGEGFGELGRGALRDAAGSVVQSDAKIVSERVLFEVRFERVVPKKTGVWYFMFFGKQVTNALFHS